VNDLFDYLDWRGDLSFGNATLCPVDTLVFAVLAYLRLEGFVPEEVRAEPVRLADAAAAYFAAHPDAKVSNHHRFLRALAESGRFGPLRLFAAQKQFDAAQGIQFSAYSVLLPGQNLLVAFEGTDDTLVGWEEDFRMSFECPVPAQLRAVEYLRDVAAAYPLRRIFVTGHSKGGNLAMFAAVHAGPEVGYRIRSVYNHDGPGFCDGTLASPEYLAMRERIHTYLPESSIVGVLLEHDENYRIVKSNAKGLAQHDPYSWAIHGPDFLYTNERTAFGRETEAIVDHFVNSFSPERKRMFGEALFAVLAASEQETVSGILSNKMQSAKNIVRGFVALDPEVRSLLMKTLGALNTSRKAVKKRAKEGGEE
jgi:hypothetical protein